MLSLKYQWWLFKDNVLHWREKLCWWVAHKLPHKIVLLCYIRVISHAWAKKGSTVPDDYRYKECYDAWNELKQK